MQRTKQKHFPDTLYMQIKCPEVLSILCHLTLVLGYDKQKCFMLLLECVYVTIYFSFIEGMKVV